MVWLNKISISDPAPLYAEINHQNKANNKEKGRVCKLASFPIPSIFIEIIVGIVIIEYSIVTKYPILVIHLA